MISQVLNGSMQPDAILWDLEKAFGAQLCALWWSECYDPQRGGVASRRVFGASRDRWEDVL